MATIYDVARAAGVSIGTVSNYLNGKYVGSVRSRSIKAAIDELHYTPNRVARSLKSRTAEQIMLILPDLNEGVYSEITSAVIHTMQDSGYEVLLELTNDSPHREEKILAKCFSPTVAGVLLCSCNPAATETFRQLQETKPLIFLLHQPDGLEKYCFVGFDNYDIIQRITRFILDEGEDSIGLWTGLETFSDERACVKAFRETLKRSGRSISADNDKIVSLASIREVIFRHATQMFIHGGYPKYILASSKLIADALIEAAYYQNILLNQNICIISLGDGKWSNSDQVSCSLSTIRSVKSLAQEACQYILECINAGGVYEYRSRQIQDEFSTTRLRSSIKQLYNNGVYHKRTLTNSKRLIIISPDCDTGVLSIRQLLPFICENTGLDIDLQLFPVSDIAPLALKQSRTQELLFDMIHLDTPWMQQVVEAGVIRDITKYFEDRPLLTNAMVPGILDALATVQGRIYGAPSLLCSQMLFYRKDFFENPFLQNSFLEHYNRPLKPPTSWFEYNLIAEFFTKSRNPESPCEFGVIMSTKDPEMMLTEVFPRIWFYGGRVFDDFGNVVLYSEETLQGIRSYLSCIQFAQPGHHDNLLPTLPVLFSQGSAAMMIGYDIHACNIMDFGRTRFYDKIGFAPLPGRISTMGGWNYCVNVHSRKLNQCYQFLDSLLSSELSIPYTLLGGGSPRKNIVSKPEVVAMYPWMQDTAENFQQSRPRRVPASVEYVNPPETEVERVIAEAVYKSMKNPHLLKNYLHDADRMLNEMRKHR